jgi:hypothetical protein
VRERRWKREEDRRRRKKEKRKEGRKREGRKGTREGRRGEGKTIQPNHHCHGYYDEII